MKNSIAVLAVIMLSGCASIMSLIPSFNDTNQSQKIIDVRMSVDQLDCARPHYHQALTIQRELRWFELYSESAGVRNQDVIRVIKPMQDSVSEFVARTEKQDASKIYCDLKKRALQEQAARAAGVILGRF
jgi:uncharacterized protein YceK